MYITCYITIRPLFNFYTTVNSSSVCALRHKFENPLRLRSKISICIHINCYAIHQPNIVHFPLCRPAPFEIPRNTSVFTLPKRVPTTKVFAQVRPLSGGRCFCPLLWVRTWQLCCWRIFIPAVHFHSCCWSLCHRRTFCLEFFSCTITNHESRDNHIDLH